MRVCSVSYVARSTWLTNRRRRRSQTSPTTAAVRTSPARNAATWFRSTGAA